jgi:rRNA maturation protein Nop10
MSQELIQCHDCGNGISFSALACPHCGSIEPSGPYRFSAKEARRYRIEERNDGRLIFVTGAMAIVGAFYGLETSSSALRALVTAPLYGFLGAAIGAPLAFAINMTRYWR